MQLARGTGIGLYWLGFTLTPVSSTGQAPALSLNETFEQPRHSGESRNPEGVWVVWDC